MEPPDLWQRYIDPAYAHAAPIGLTEMPRDMRVRVKNHTLLRLGRRAAAAGRRPQDRVARGARRRLRRRRGAGLGPGVAGARRWTPRASTWPCCSRRAACSCSASTRSSRSGTDGLEPAYATAIARAYNDWLADFCGHAPDRMFGAAMVAPHDVDGAVAEARRCVEELGLQGDLPRAGLRQPPALAPPRLRPAVGRDRAARRARSPSTAAARPTSRPTSRSRCSTS